MAFLGSTDQPTTNDMFGIGNYIKGLCSFIADCPTPMTIAIQGDWGSGKTSIMEMVKKQLEQEPVHCVWVNTWQFSQFNTDANLPISLIHEIIQGFDIDRTKTGKEIIEEIGHIGVSLLKRAAYGAAYRAMDLTIGSTNTADVRKNLLNGADEILGMNKIARNLKNRFQKCVDEALAGNNAKRILLFVDDLDRLEPLRAVELLEVLKNFLDCENCVFVLAIDYNVVVRGIRSKYGTDIDEEKGRSFFDKIIQVPFKVPVAQYDISHFVKEILTEVEGIEGTDTEADDYVALINSSIGSNPRSMIRLFNSFFLLIKVVGEELLDRDIMNRKTLFAILCMQQHFESLYNYIVVNRDTVNTGFFSGIVNAADAGEFFDNEGVDIKSEDTDDIKDFIKAFIKVHNHDIDDDGISEEVWTHVKELLNCSSVTATESGGRGMKKRPTFKYKGDTYMAQGANRMNLGNLALRLITDYSKETDKDADKLMDMVNENISCYTTALKKADLHQVSDRTNPLLRNRELLSMHFSAKDELIRLSERVLIVSKGWGAPELTKLVELLEYDDRVTSNVK